MGGVVERLTRQTFNLRDRGFDSRRPHMSLLERCQKLRNETNKGGETRQPGKPAARKSHGPVKSPWPGSSRGWGPITRSLPGEEAGLARKAAEGEK